MVTGAEGVGVVCSEDTFDVGQQRFEFLNRACRIPGLTAPVSEVAS